MQADELANSVQEWERIHRHGADSAFLLSHRIWRLCVIFRLNQGRFVISSGLVVLGTDDAPTAATNFPENRGTATAFPLAAFGLSAFFFSSLASLLFHGDTTQLLLLLAL